MKNDDRIPHPDKDGMSFLDWALIWGIFALGIYLIVLNQFGPDWSMVPGNLSDGRFNNYILEHFYLWTKSPIRNYWNAPFFYPYTNVIAFSDNLLGAAPLYAALRWIGLSRETAFQGWYLLSFCFSYAAAVYVLSRSKLHASAIGFGAFFFSFGLPLLAEEVHSQLFYRFCIPLACYFFFAFFHQPTLKRLVATIFFLVWQFYLSIYLGFFLIMLLAVLAILMPVTEKGISIKERLLLWPKKLLQSWSQSSIKEKFVLFVITTLTGLAYFWLMLPYYKATQDYNFHRPWSSIYHNLPTFNNFWSAYHSTIWRFISTSPGTNINDHESQLFVGIAVLIIIIIGVVARFKTKNNQIAWAYLGAALLITILTSNFNGYSIYWLIWMTPGFNSIRAVARIQFVLMWPLAFFAAYTIDGILRSVKQKNIWLHIGIAIITIVLISESTFIQHVFYPKAVGVARITDLKKKLPPGLTKNSILVVGVNPREPIDEKRYTQIDSMLVADELGFYTMNGHSGNYPLGYITISNCQQISMALKKYAQINHIQDKHAFNQAFMQRLVILDINNCNLDAAPK